MDYVLFTDNIADLPVEAIARVETLPRGSAQRVNGAPGQQVFIAFRAIESMAVTTTEN